jgi:tetratricopeptide (TPR) repeat protein
LQGNFAAAQKCYEEALIISREFNDEHGVAYALICLGIFARTKNLTEAHVFLEESLAILRKYGNKEAISNNLNNLGGVAFEQGNFEASQLYFTEALEMAQEVGNKVNIADALNGFAALAANYGKSEQSAQLTGAAASLCKSIGYDQEPIERSFCENYIAKIKTTLGEKDFSNAFKYGHSMNIKEAWALAKSCNRAIITEPAQYLDEVVIESHTLSRIWIEENIGDPKD